MIENMKQEAMLIYHSDKSDDKKARGYAEALNGYVIKTWDLKRDPITETQLAEMANSMNLPIAELVDSSYHTGFGKDGSAKTMEEEDILTLLAKDPMQLKTPILLIDKKAFQCHSSYELIKEKMDEGGVKRNTEGNRIEDADA